MMEVVAQDYQKTLESMGERHGSEDRADTFPLQTSTDTPEHSTKQNRGRVGGGLSVEDYMKVINRRFGSISKPNKQHDFEKKRQHYSSSFNHSASVHAAILKSQALNENYSAEKQQIHLPELPIGQIAQVDGGGISPELKS